MSYDLRVNDAAARRVLRRMEPELLSTLDRSLARGAQATAREMKREAPKAETVLANSIKADQQTRLSWFVGPHVAHGLYVERGRRPGGRMPPLQKIMDWTRVVLRPSPAEQRNVAFRVARKIARQGIPPNRFARRTFETMDPLVKQQVDTDVTRTVRRLAGTP